MRQQARRVLLQWEDPFTSASVLSCLQGYEGLVEGGENIKRANWLSVSNIIQLVSCYISLSPSVSIKASLCRSHASLVHLPHSVF